MDQFAFNPTNGLADATVFTNPTSEAETRNQLNELHIQTRNFINTMVTQINSMLSDITALQAAVGDPDAIQEILDAVGEIEDFLAVSDTITYVGDDEEEETSE